MEKKRVNSSEVARVAGVSRATVSAVINKTRPVSDEVVERVERVMRQLNYQPDAVARSLKSRRTYRLGLVAARLSSPYWAKVINVIQETAYAHGFHVVLSHTDDDPDKEMAHLQMMISQRVDGIILATCGQVDPEYITRLTYDVPIVLYDRRLPIPSVDTISCDNVYGSYVATRHFIENVGIRRIACLTINLDSSTGAERVAGYRNALSEFAIPFKPEWVKVGKYTEESGFEDALELLRAPDRPQAVFAGSHLRAVGVLRAAQAVGLKLPEDLALIGFDEMPWAAFMCPPLTVVVQPVVEMASHAAQKLIALINRRAGDETDHGHERVEQVLYRPRLIVRDSCGYSLFQNRAGNQLSNAEPIPEE